MVDTKISALPAVVTPAGTDEFAVNQAGTSKKMTLAQFLGLPLGLTGATAATRFVGGTTAGSPTSGTFAVGDYVVDQSGQIIFCTTAGTPGSWRVARNPYDFAITGGEQTMNPGLAVGNWNGAVATGYIYLSHFRAQTNDTVANVSVRCLGTATVTPTIVRMGLYTVASNGDCTLVANTANDTAILSTVWTNYTKALAASYAFIPGQMYAAGIIQLAATLGIYPYVTGEAQSMGARPRFTSRKGGLSDLPSSITDATLDDYNTAGPYLTFTA